MIGCLVITHGAVAGELVAAARRIVGEIKDLEAVSIDWSDDAEAARSKIQRALERLESRQQVLILTDMFGGTPTNTALTFLERDCVEVITGVNLPMLIRFASLKADETLMQAAQRICTQGQRSIHVASQMLASLSEAAQGA